MIRQIVRWFRFRLKERELRQMRVRLQPEPDWYRDWLEKAYGKEGG